MKSKTESCWLSHALSEHIQYILYSAEYQQKPVVALKIKGAPPPFQIKRIIECQKTLSVGNNPSVLKLIDVVSTHSSSGTMVIIESFSNTIYEHLAQYNLKFSQKDLLNHAITLSSGCASLVSEGCVPLINFDTLCLDNKGAIKLIHPHLFDTLKKYPQEVSSDYYETKANAKIHTLFLPPEAHARHCKKDEAFSVYQFGLFLLYSSIGNLDFMNKSEAELSIISSKGAHPDIPAHCHPDIARLITNCLKPATERPSFAEISNYLSIHPKIEQAQTAVKNLQQDKANLLSRVPKEIINNDLMKAIEAHGVFTRSKPEEMKNKIESLKLGKTLNEDTHYMAYSAEYQGQPAVALKIKGGGSNLFTRLTELKEKFPVSNHSSALKLIDVVSNQSGSKNIVIIEGFSNIFYELLAKNNLKLSQADILNHAIILSADCASLVSEGHAPIINFETVCLDNNGGLKLIHPHLVDTIHSIYLETSHDRGMSKATNKIKELFRSPESRVYPFKRNEASSVYEFGLFLLYSSIGNLDFMNISMTELYNISETGAHPDIPAHCHPDIARLITNCLKPATERPSFAEISDYLSIHPKIEQAQTTAKNLQQDKTNLLSRVPKEIINNDLMKAIEDHGVFARSNSLLPEIFDNSHNNTARPK